LDFFIDYVTRYATKEAADAAADESSDEDDMSAISFDSDDEDEAADMEL
jgi:ubiquitin-conjugating enzyme E2 H